MCLMCLTLCQNHLSVVNIKQNSLTQFLVLITQMKMTSAKLLKTLKVKIAKVVTFQQKS